MRTTSAFSQGTGRRCSWEWQAVNPLRAERGRKAVRGLFLDGRVHVAKGVRRPLRAVLRPTFRTPSQGFSEEGNGTTGTPCGRNTGR